MDGLWTQWTGSKGKDISERRDCSKSRGDHPVLKLDGVTTRWTFYERNCRTSDQLGTQYNVVQSGISYSTCARRPRAFLLRWSCSYTDPTRPYCDRNHFHSDWICSKQNKTFWISWCHAPTQFIKFAVGSHEVLLVLSTSVRFSPSPYNVNPVHRTMVRGRL